MKFKVGDTVRLIPNSSRGFSASPGATAKVEGIRELEDWIVLSWQSDYHTQNNGPYHSSDFRIIEQEWDPEEE